MGLFDAVLGNLLSGSPLQSILTSVIGGSGGLGGLVEQFEKAGMGQVVGSWVGNGPNQPVSPADLGKVFNQEQISQWAQQAGMSQDSVLAELSKMLPHAVDHMTPNGEVPAAADAPASPFDEQGVAFPTR